MVEAFGGTAATAFIVGASWSTLAIAEVTEIALRTLVISSTTLALVVDTDVVAAFSVGETLDALSAVGNIADGSVATAGSIV